MRSGNKKSALKVAPVYSADCVKAAETSKYLQRDILNGIWRLARNAEAAACQRCAKNMRSEKMMIIKRLPEQRPLHREAAK